MPDYQEEFQKGIPECALGIRRRECTRTCYTDFL
jgi:hypothetical protein